MENALNYNSKITNNLFWPIIFFFIGMVMVIYQSVGFDLSVMPGGLGDGRFNNYILEHGYRFFTGQEKLYWNAPFFFPERNMVSYSDNLFGALPIYIFFRQWVDRETAYQLWYLILIALNYIGAYIALRKLNISKYASSVGAFIYAFSIIICIQTSHIQLLVRFVAPYSIVSFYLWLHGASNKYVYISIFLLTYQFYCAIYLGYFLMYVLLIILGIFIVRERSVKFLMKLIDTKKNIIYTSIFGCLMLAILGILFYPYLLRSMDGYGYPPVKLLNLRTPRLWSYILVHEESFIWGFTNPYIVNIFASDDAYTKSKQLFVGLLPNVFVIIAFIKYRNVYAIKYFLITLSVILIVTLSVFNFNLYMFLVYFIPGARAVRVVARYIVIVIFIWSIISAYVLDRILIKPSKWITVLIFVLPIMLVFDNLCLLNKKGSDKKYFQERSLSIVREFEKNIKSNPKAKAFSVHFTIDTTLIENEKNKFIYLNHIDAMMASQIIGLPCVNGYSAREPEDCFNYFMNPNTANLNAWLHSNRVKNTVKEKYELTDILIIEK